MHLHKRRALLLCTLIAACSTIVATDTGTSLAEVVQETQRPLESAETTNIPEPEVDPKTAEADKALTDALAILKALDALPPTTASPSDPSLPPWLASLFPNPSGPLASTLRIITKLRAQSWLPTFLSTRASRDEARVRQRVTRLVGLLEKAVELGNTEAMYVFAHVSMYPPVGLGVDTKKAYKLYKEHAEVTGNGTSQGMLGFFYASGYGGVTPVDQAKASLYYTFGAAGGDPASQMAMGYRYWAGIGVAEDCMAALEWYERASNQA
ncbi:ERAD-associated protein, partial [Ceratobasidium sp. 394]